jgi:hypothetical protein
MQIAMGNTDFNGRCQLSLTGRVVEDDAVFWGFTPEASEDVSLNTWCRGHMNHGFTLLECALVFSPVNHAGAGTFFFASGLNAR